MVSTIQENILLPPPPHNVLMVAPYFCLESLIVSSLEECVISLCLQLRELASLSFYWSRVCGFRQREFV